MYRFATVLAVIFATFLSTANVYAQLPTITLTTSSPIQDTDLTFNFPGGGTYTTGTYDLGKVTIMLKIVKISNNVEVFSDEKPTIANNGNYTGIINHPTWDPTVYKYYMRARLYVKEGADGPLQVAKGTVWTPCGELGVGLRANR